MDDKGTRKARAEKGREDLEAAVADAAVLQAETGDKEIAGAFSIVQGAFDHLYEIVGEQGDQIEELTERVEKLEEE
jgi:hypothetical protein